MNIFRTTDTTDITIWKPGLMEKCFALDCSSEGKVVAGYPNYDG